MDSKNEDELPEKTAVFGWADLGRGREFLSDLVNKFWQLSLFSHSGQSKRTKHCGIYTFSFDDGLLAAMLRPYTIKAFGIFPSESDGRALWQPPRQLGHI